MANFLLMFKPFKWLSWLTRRDKDSGMRVGSMGFVEGFETFSKVMHYSDGSFLSLPSSSYSTFGKAGEEKDQNYPVTKNICKVYDAFMKNQPNNNKLEIRQKYVQRYARVQMYEFKKEMNKKSSKKIQVRVYQHNKQKH
ncbi:hypothetical protein GQX74_013577 [Glossina fuscipes]|nr:hypothetical protein GQX74_013577 [Glossina fuscipes]